MFNKKTTYSTTVKVLPVAMPTVEITLDALTKMKLFIDGCADEIGWLGTAYKSNNVYTIEDVFLFGQEVHSTTTEITPDGLGEFAEYIMSNPSIDGVEIWNNLKMWGHSHVNMACNPSGQDDTQMNTFAQSGHDWFIRLIGNKKGELRIDIYDYANGIQFLDVPWNEVESLEEQNILAQINELYARIDGMKQSVIDAYKPIVTTDIAAKVKKKVYTQTDIGTYIAGKTRWCNIQRRYVPITQTGQTQTNVTTLPVTQSGQSGTTDSTSKKDEERGIIEIQRGKHETVSSFAFRHFTATDMDEMWDVALSHQDLQEYVLETYGYLIDDQDAWDLYMFFFQRRVY